MSAQKFHVFMIFSVFVLLSITFYCKQIQTSSTIVRYQPQSRIVKVKKAKVPWLKELPSQFGSRKWRTYLPEVDDLLIKIEQGVVKWPVDIKLTTDPRSSVILLPNSDNLKVGDKLSGSIQAKDFFGNAKRHGGDHFRARLMRITDSMQLTEDGITVMVQDNMNGTYDWNTIIPWHGRCKLMIELVHSSEAVAELIARRATLVNIQRGFVARFSNGDSAKCDITISNGTSVCDYSRPEHGITWICEMPDNTTCPKIIPMFKITKNVGGVLGREPLFNKNATWQVELKNSGKTFIVNGDVKIMPKNIDRCDTSTGIKRFASGRNNKPSGYYYKREWTSLLCDNKYKNLKQAGECLQHKSVYFIGDSTMRQWYFGGIASASKIIDSLGGSKGSYWSMSRNGSNFVKDIDIYYRSHGNPLHNPGPPISRPYIVDTLRSITGNRNTVVVFNIGAHFLPYDPSVIIQRAAGIKNALIDLHKRLPSVQIFLRGAVRFTGSFRGPLSEWLYMRTDRILRHYFSDLPYIGHIDTWDMTTMLPQKSVHAIPEVVDQFVSSFLSYIC